MFLGSNLNNNYDNSASIRLKLQKSLRIIRCYDWLIDSYILDFYVDDHWNKLPKSWRDHLDLIEPEDLSVLLNDRNSKLESTKAWPLSLIVLRNLIQELSIDRLPLQDDVFQLPRSPMLKEKKLKNLFGKCVKPKKLHEIEQMAAICNECCEKYNVDFLIDFGAGQGHLARLLGYGYGVKVCCLEMQKDLSIQASVIDQHLEKIAKKHLSPNEIQGFQRPTHLTMHLTASMQPSEFLDTLRIALNIQNDNFRFGIVGLHPCGDLGTILMRILLKCKQARFLNFVGCCYMKLSTNSDNSIIHPSPLGYPLSQYLKSQESSKEIALSYEAREIACHAIEVYNARLKTSNYDNLKIHSYRAAAERIITRHWPDSRHIGLRSVKCTDGLEFENYFYKAVKSLPAENLNANELKTDQTLHDLRHWKRVVIFYTLRLMFAPLVESVILYDRILYLMEHDCEVQINAAFNPLLSPRNHVTSAIKLS